MDPEWEALKSDFARSFAERIQRLNLVIQWLQQNELKKAQDELYFVSHKLAGVAQSFGFMEISELAIALDDELTALEKSGQIADSDWMQKSALELRRALSQHDELSTKTSSDSWLVAGLAIYSICMMISMAMMSIGAVLLLICAGVYFTQLDDRSLVQKRIQEFWLLPQFKYLALTSLALSVACLLSLIVADWMPLVYQDYRVPIRYFADMAKAWYLFWPFVLALLISFLSTEGKARVLKSWWVAFALVSLIGVIQYFTGWPRLQRIPGNDSRFHATLFFGHHLSTASILIFPFFLQLEMILKKKIPLGLGAVALLLSTLTLFFTYSRTLWIALPVGILFWIFQVMPRHLRKWAISGGIFVLAMASQISWIRMRMQDTLGVSSRKSMWEANWDFFIHRPWTGVGWHHNHDLTVHYLAQKWGVTGFFAGHAHNMVLEMLGTTGLLGLAAWLVWMGLWLGLARTVASRGSIWGRAMICAWIVFQLNGLTQVNFWEGKVLHQVMWVVAWLLVVQFQSQDGFEEPWFQKS